MEEILTPQPAGTTPVPPKGNDDSVGYGTYFGLIALFLIPVVGLICSIVFSFAGKNKNVKNFARAAMTVILIEVVATAIAVGVAVWAFRAVTAAVNDFLTDPENIAQFGPIGELLSELPEEDLQQILDQFQSGGIEGLMEQFQNGEFDHILSQFSDEELQGIMPRFQNGEYGEISDVSDLLDQMQTTDTATP